jgi:transaldolase
VGGKVDVTLNWPGSIQSLDETPPAIESLMDKPVPENVIHELCAKLPTFASAYAEGGLKPDEFADFGPVVRFRTQFLKGWNELLETIRERRAKAPHRGFCKVGENPCVEMRPGVYRTTLVYNGDQMLCHFREKAGARVDLHTHVAVQSGYVLRGKVRFFDAMGKERVMGAGDAYLFNSNEPHGSVALEEAELVECFTPLRREYLDGCV